MIYELAVSGTVLAIWKGEKNTQARGYIMKAPKKPATIYRWVEDPTQACLGRTGNRVARVVEQEPVPGKIFVPAAGVAERARKAAGRFILYEKRGSLGVITAKVHNIGDVYDEIDALLDEIELDGDIQTIAIHTLNGLFALLPIR